MPESRTCRSKFSINDSLYRLYNRTWQQKLEMSSDHVVVVGGGVIGLTIAHQLLQSTLKPKELTIISQHFPRDVPISHEYTSPWAGAHFRPFPHRPELYESDKRESAYTRETYKYFKKLVKAFPESTIEFMKGIDYLEEPTPEYANLGPGFNSSSLDSFKQISSENLPSAVKTGFEYTTYCLNAPEYLKFLQDQITTLSKYQKVKLNIKRMTLHSLREAYDLFPTCTTLFNATGQGLQLDGGQDPQCFGIRGQTLLLDVPHPTKYGKVTITHQSKDGNWTFVIKRPSTNGKPQFILGGTKQPGDGRIMPRDADSQAIMERAKVLYPDLMVGGKFNVVGVNVGFRPARTGGSRVQTEYTTHKGRPVCIVHSYGLGGMGYETSVGVALHALKLYSESRSSSKL